MAKTKKKIEEDVPTDVLLAWCIDRSGSMQGFQQDTIDGFNAFLEEQKELDGNAWLSLVLFDTIFDVPTVAMDIHEVEPLNRQSYAPAGGTALYDAVGLTIDGIEAWLANNKKFDGKVLVTVWTDGGENSSSKWAARLGGLKLMMERVREKQDDGWIFSFLGAGGAAWTEGEQFASTFGVQNTTQVAANAQGVRASYAASSTGARMLRSSGKYNGTSDYLAEATMDSLTMSRFGVEDTAMALAGTKNVTSTDVDEEEE